MPDHIRIDRLLFFLRLVKSRSLAQKIIDAGHVRLDGSPVRAFSASVQPGQVITLPLHDSVRVIRLVSLPNHRGPAPFALSCYEDLSTLTCVTSD